MVKGSPESFWLGGLTNHVSMVAHGVPGAFVQFPGYIPGSDHAAKGVLGLPEIGVEDARALKFP